MLALNRGWRLPRITQRTRIAHFHFLAAWWCEIRSDACSICSTLRSRDVAEKYGWKESHESASRRDDKNISRVQFRVIMQDDCVNAPAFTICFTTFDSRRLRNVNSLIVPIAHTRDLYLCLSARVSEGEQLRKQ